MLQGLDIPWGVMVDTWDLTFSSTSDVPDRLDLCSNWLFQHRTCPSSILQMYMMVYRSLHLYCGYNFNFCQYDMPNSGKLPQE